jgi:hypothetical protein
MPRAKFFNSQLRSFILQHSIRQEALTAEILKFIFKILKNETKTFANTGSSISFKNKIDFLYDLEEITKTDYSHFAKLLEIRNQFAHNPNCYSVVALNNEKKEYVNYLLSIFPNTEIETEKKISKSCIDLFKHCHKILCKIKKAYVEKLDIEIQRYQSFELLNNKFYDWVSEAKKDFEKFWVENKMDNLEIKQDKISFFILSFRCLEI